LGDIDAANALLARHPEVASFPRAVPVIARVLWESKQRLKAIETLSRHLRTGPETFEPYAQLAQWQLTSEMADDAVRTAEAAIARFPTDLAPRVLLVEAQGVRTNRGREFAAVVETYLKEQGAKPDAPRSTFNADHAKRMEVLMPRVEIPRGGVVPKMR
jgi:hypothetical protein